MGCCASNQSNVAESRRNMVDQMPKSKYSIQLPIQVEFEHETAVMEMSDGLMYNYLVKLGVQKQKQQSIKDSETILLCSSSEKEQSVIYQQFGFILLETGDNMGELNGLLQDQKTAKVLFNFKHLWVFQDRIKQKPYLLNLLKTFDAMGIKIKQLNYYPKTIKQIFDQYKLNSEISVQKKNIHYFVFQILNSLFPLQIFNSSDVLDQTMRKEEPFCIYIHGSSHIQSLYQNEQVGLYSKSLQITNILFAFEHIDMKLIKHLESQYLYKVEQLGFKEDNEDGQPQLNRKAMNQMFVPMIQRLCSLHSNLLIVHDSSQVSSIQLVREAIELYMAKGLLIHQEDIKKYLDQRRQLVIHSSSRVMSQLKVSTKVHQMQQEIQLSRWEDILKQLNELYKKQKSQLVPSSCFTTVQKLLENIIENANDPKYRTIYKTNKRIQLNVLQYGEGIEIFKLVGFSEPHDNDQIYINNLDIGQIKLARGDLELAYKKFLESVK